MIYWVTGTIPSSMRFYKEAFAGKALVAIGLPVTVPSGVVAFPHEIISHVPESFCYWGYPNLVHYTTMPTGGHFPAFEQPALLAEDIRAFARKVEALDTPKEKTPQ
ncbi:epoxide hydrolase 1-like [Branchiostoma floridae]|uniref:Epoxide hydrolase 1-like n=1 Tax=Branchiostoma floridae TaxID=7739 RepID=A0A9J7HI96_BRAFL|nr:epoxide hydrolase 1-like [Branchiostoma floridae]